MKNILNYAPAIILIFGLFSCKNTNSQNDKYLITPQEMQELLLMKEVQLVDVRTPEEYGAGYVENAINVNYYDDGFEKDLASKLDKSKPVCVYCKKGGRSAKAAAKLRDMGFTEVYDMKGGFDSWKSKDMPISN